MPLLEFVAKRLRELRAMHGLTQEQMATLLKTDIRWYQRVESAEKDIRATTLDRLGKLFGISGRELVADKIPETKISARIPAPPHRGRPKGKRRGGAKKVARKKR